MRFDASTVTIGAVSQPTTVTQQNALLDVYAQNPKFFANPEAMGGYAQECSRQAMLGKGSAGRGC